MCVFASYLVTNLMGASDKTCLSDSPADVEGLTSTTQMGQSWRDRRARSWEKTPRQSSVNLCVCAGEMYGLDFQCGVSYSFSIDLCTYVVLQ